MTSSFEYSSNLQYKVKALEHENKQLKSGEAYTKMEKGFERMRSYYEREIKRLKKELDLSKKKNGRLLDEWMEVFDDVQKEGEKRVDSILKSFRDRERRLLEMLDKAEETIRQLREKIAGKTSELVAERERANGLEDKIQKLQGQINQNHTNSSIPSSKDSFRGVVHNNRKPTGRKQGGQPGHEGHGRKPVDNPDSIVVIEAPDEIRNNPDWYPQSGESGTVKKQLFNIRVIVTVTEYQAQVYRNRKTGERYTPDFPKGVVLDVNYDPSVKHMIFIMRNQLNVSEENIRTFLKNASGGRLDVSRGMINGVNHEFSQKTEAEMKELFERLVDSKILHTDMTGARMNGKLKNIVVCSNRKDVAFFFREKKGFEGYNGTPVETTDAILEHDHDRTLYHYGSNHQDCNAHHIRYLIGAAETEKNLTWHTKMLGLLREMNETREKAPGRVLETAVIEDFERRYDEILDIADAEYNDNPPSVYYRKGYNLSKELREFKQYDLLFLRMPDVEFSNNEAERTARIAKRHVVIMGTFRGKTNRSAEEYCSAMSVFQSLKNSDGGEGAFAKTLEMFSRSKDKKIQERDSAGRFLPVSNPS